MKKSIMMAMVAGLAGLLLTGCATQSPYVGTWEGQADGEGFVLKLTEEGRMVFEHTDGDGDVFLGIWEITDEGKVELTAEGEDEKAIVTLLDDNELILSVGGDSAKFTRQD